MTFSPSDTLVKVRILDKDYSIRGESEASIRRIADYLNEEGRKLLDGAPVHNRIDLAVMVAFKAAGDFFSAREDLERLLRRVESESEALSSRIDDNLFVPTVRD